MSGREAGLGDHRDRLAYDRLAYLRDRFAELRQDHAFITREYRAGRLSPEAELMLLKDLMPEIGAIISEVVALTEPHALF